MNPLASFSAFVITLALGYLMIVAAAAVAGAIARGGRRERAVDAYEALAVSRFTIPVSLIVPVPDPRVPVSRAVAALLDLNYPELEVVMVAEANSPAIDTLKAEWTLEPKEFFYRRSLDTGPVHRIYASERDPRLIVIEKAAGSRADALNCGASFARFRYVVPIQPDVVFDRDALLRLMSPALRDPGAVLAVTSYVERQGGAAVGVGGEDVEWTKAGDDYQRLASIRSWMASRLAWHQLHCGLPPRDGVTAWRRDALLELGGFSLTAADPELDLLVRLQTARTDGSSGHVVRTSEVFGHTGTLTVMGAAQAAARRQRAVVEAFSMFRRMPGRSAERQAMMRVIAVELMTPAVQGLVLAAIVAGVGAGWFNWRTPFNTLLLLTFGYGLVSASALLLRGGTPGAPTGADLKRLILRAPLEFVVYRPALLWARALGNR